MGNYVIAVGNYVIVSPSELGNYLIADIWPADSGGALSLTAQAVNRDRRARAAETE
jgi:hypothetical protein